MRIIIYILLSIIFLASCSKDVVKAYAGDDKRLAVKAVFCLRDMLIGEDPNGTWTVINQPSGANLETLLTTDSPCFDWATKPCGQYRLRYVVGDICCRDTSFVNPLKCCIAGISTCN